MTAFGVFWGIFMLIIMLGAGNGLYNGAMNEFNRMASNSIFVWTRTTTIPYKGFPNFILTMRTSKLCGSKSL